MNTPTQVTYRAVTDNRIVMGRRYRLGLIVSFLPDGSVSPSVDKSKLEAELKPQWMIELLAPTGDVTGSVQSWILQGMAKVDARLQDTPMVTYAAVAREVWQNELPTTPPVVMPTTASSSGGSMKGLIVGALALAGLWWLVPRLKGVFR